MSETQAPTVEQLKLTYRHLAFIHQKLMSTTFYLEEIQQADAAARFITDLANKVAKDIDALQAQAVAEEQGLFEGTKEVPEVVESANE